MLLSTTAALRFNPLSFARFIGERLNDSLNSSSRKAGAGRESEEPYYHGLSP
jgi:hypothetical protein